MSSKTLIHVSDGLHTALTGASVANVLLNKLFLARKATPPVKAALTLMPRWGFFKPFNTCRDRL